MIGKCGRPFLEKTGLKSAYVQLHTSGNTKIRQPFFRQPRIF